MARGSSSNNVVPSELRRMFFPDGYTQAHPIADLQAQEIARLKSELAAANAKTERAMACVERARAERDVVKAEGVAYKTQAENEIASLKHRLDKCSAIILEHVSADKVMYTRLTNPLWENDRAHGRFSDEDYEFAGLKP